MSTLKTIGAKFGGIRFVSHEIVQRLVKHLLADPSTIEDECGHKFLETPFSAQTLLKLLHNNSKRKDGDVGTAQMTIFVKKDYNLDGINLKELFLFLFRARLKNLLHSCPSPQILYYIFQ